MVPSVRQFGSLCLLATVAGVAVHRTGLDVLARVRAPDGWLDVAGTYPVLSSMLLVASGLVLTAPLVLLLESH
jgi:NAD-dependent oxidoreductase involved in siderophore biosynthesis